MRLNGSNVERGPFVADRPRTSIAVALAVLVAAGCSNDDESPQASERTITISGVSYNFPVNLVKGFVTPEQGRPFVRISPPHRRFMLVYSARSSEQSEQGSQVPTIPFINDFPNGPVDIVSTPQGMVICATASYPFNCGFRIDDARVPWNVMFGRDHLSQVSAIKAEAMALIATFRT